MCVLLWVATDLHASAPRQSTKPELQGPCHGTLACLWSSGEVSVHSLPFSATCEPGLTCCCLLVHVCLCVLRGVRLVLGALGWNTNAVSGSSCSILAPGTGSDRNTTRGLLACLRACLFSVTTVASLALYAVCTPHISHCGTLFFLAPPL